MQAPMPFAMPSRPIDKPFDTPIEILDIKAHYYVHRANFEALANLFDAEGPSRSRSRHEDPHTGRAVCDFPNFDLIGVDPAGGNVRPQPQVTVTVRGLWPLIIVLVKRGCRLMDGPRRLGSHWQVFIADAEGHVYEYIEEDVPGPGPAVPAPEVPAWRPSQLASLTPG